MSEKPQADEFEDEEADEPVVGDGDVDLDQVTKELDLAKRRGKAKHTAELTSDFEDYKIGDGARGKGSRNPRGG
jgi:hypothetical protein